METVVLAIAPTSFDLQGRWLQNPPTHHRTRSRSFLLLSWGTLTSLRGEVFPWKFSAKLDEPLPSRYPAKPLISYPKQPPIWFQVAPSGQAWQTSDIQVIRLIKVNFRHFQPSPLYWNSAPASPGFSFGDWRCDCCHYRL